MLMNPSVYAKLLGEKIEKHGSEVYLINTGWFGRAYGKGHRRKLSYTRYMIKVALKGQLRDVSYNGYPIFKVLVPVECPGVPKEIRNPENTWNNKEEYNKTAREFIVKFKKNFTKFLNVTQDVLVSSPDEDYFYDGTKITID